MHPRLLSRSVLAGASALGLFAALGTGPASAAVHPATARGGASARATALAFLKHLKIGDHGTDQAVFGHATSNGQNLTQVQSVNWSGYADHGSGTKYSKVAGAWTEPTGKCGSGTSFAAFWVGIDGFKSKTVEQDGTLIECSGGSAHYFSWYEMYPAGLKVVGSTVKPGDKISASVAKSGTSYTLKVTDSTTSGNNVSTTKTCSASTCVDASAEWIAEAPCCVSGSTPYPLSNFGTWSLSGGTVTGSGKAGTISSFADNEITMVNGTSGATEAKPGALNSAGNAFKVTWVSA